MRLADKSPAASGCFDALEGLPNKVMATEYKTALPEEKLIADELDRTRRLLEERKGQ